MNTITKHYIDVAFVESHGTEVMDIIKPTNGRVIGRVGRRRTNASSPPPPDSANSTSPQLPSHHAGTTPSGLQL